VLCCFRLLLTHICICQTTPMLQGLFLPPFPWETFSGYLMEAVLMQPMSPVFPKRWPAPQRLHAFEPLHRASHTPTKQLLHNQHLVI
jgi:hypothetical protein